MYVNIYVFVDGVIIGSGDSLVAVLRLVDIWTNDELYHPEQNARKYQSKSTW